MIKFINGKPAI